MKKMKKKTAQLLAFLIKTEKNQCPPDKYFPLNEKELLFLAQKNKAVPFLFHLIDCPVCKQKINKEFVKKISKFQKASLVLPLLYQEEKKIIGKFCQKEKIKAILIKDFSFYPQMKHHQDFLMGLDLDFLIDIKNSAKIESFLKKRGYKLELHLKLRNKNGQIIYQEKTFIHPQKKVNLDFHYQIAIPQENEFHFLTTEIIKTATEKIIQNSNYKKKIGLYVPNQEYFLTSLLIHYLGSDLLKGLRNLFDIIKFVNLYDEQINWKKVLKLCQQFQIKNSALFVLFLGSQNFNLPMPKNLQKTTKIPLKVRFFAPYWSVEKIANFPPIKKWNKRSKEAKEIFYENFFLRLFLADTIPFSRLIRPRIIFFFLKTGLIWINKVVSPLYQKPLKLKPTRHQSLANE